MRKQDAAGEEWRASMQDEQMWKILKPVGTVLNVLGIAVMCATIPDQTRVPGVAGCMVMALVAIAMYLRFPQYYSLLGEKEYRKIGLTERVKHVELGVFAPCFGLAMQIVHFLVLGWGWLILLTLLLAAVVLALLWFGSLEVREYGGARLVAVLTALTLSFGIVVNGNHYLNFDSPPPEEYTVIGTDRTNRSRGGDRYYAVIEIDTGREVKIPLSYDRYKVTHPGDTVPVYDDTGAFGIRYAWYAEE